jgi:hypothetical protein
MMFVAGVWLMLVWSRLAVVLRLLLLWVRGREGLRGSPLLLLLGRVLVLRWVDRLLWLLRIGGLPRAGICRLWCLLLRG